MATYSGAPNGFASAASGGYSSGLDRGGYAAPPQKPVRAAENIRETPKQTIALIGVPDDQNSSFMRGPASAPEAIRAALGSDAGNNYAENGTLVWGPQSVVEDAGDVMVHNLGPDVVARNTSIAVARLLQAGLRPMVLGGDHSITFPVLAGVSQAAVPALCDGIVLVHWDAHADLYPEFPPEQPNPWSHASPFARILEAGLVHRLVQVGIRTLTPEQRQMQAKYSVNCLGMLGGAAADAHQVAQAVAAACAGLKRPACYVSIDLDALDPAFAPGVSHHEPGGLATRHILDALHAIQLPLVGADVVELNPIRDVHGMTAVVAAKLVKELCSIMISRPLY